RPNGSGDQIQSLVPAHSSKADFSSSAHHRARQSTHGAQLGAGLPRQWLHSGQAVRIERAAGVQPQQSEPHVAEVNALDRPIAKPAGAQRAAVADAVLEDPPRVAQPISVLPEGSGDLQIVVRSLLPNAERLLARPQRRGPAPWRRLGHRARIADPTANRYSPDLVLGPVLQAAVAGAILNVCRGPPSQIGWLPLCIAAHDRR